MTSEAIELGGQYRATIRIRRGKGWVVKPKAEARDGRTFVFEARWRITTDDNSDYAGEWAMYSRELEPFGLVWVASGDCVLEPVAQSLN